MIFYNYSFRFLDADRNIYLLRKSEITAVKVIYRTTGTTDSFTQTLDFNIDEKINTLWVRLPQGTLDIVITLNVQPLRTLTTGLQSLTFSNTTTAFDLTATPVPLNSQQGYSPRVIGGYWYEYDDANQTFTNTGISVAGTAISETTTVDDFLQLDDLNPVTSNAVKKRTDELQQQVTENATQINLNGTAIQALELHKNSVTINGVTTEEDTAGNINLGENISAADIVTVTTEKDEITSAKENEDGPLGNICLQEGATLLNGEIVGGKYGRHFICYNSPTLAYYIFDENCTATSFYIQIDFFDQKMAGHIFMCKDNGYNKVYTDNPLLCNYIYDGGVYYNPASGGMETNIWIYADNFADIPKTVTNYAGDVSRLKKILYGQNAKSWIEVRATPYVIDSFKGELDLSVNIPAVTLNLPSDLTYPQTIVIKNIQGAACTLSATGYTDMVLDDQTINYITLTSATEWTKVSTKNEAGAQGVKIGDDATVYPVDAQGIINLPTQADGNTVMIDMTKNAWSSLNPQEIVNGTHYIAYVAQQQSTGVYELYLHGTNPTCVVTIPKNGDTVLLTVKNGDGNWVVLRACTKYSDNYIVNGALVGYHEYVTATGGNVSAYGNLTYNNICYAYGDKVISTMSLTPQKLLKDLDILYSMLDGLLTYKCDGATVTNGVTKKANKMVTTAYSVTSIATGAIMDIEHGDPFLITSDAAKMAGQMLLDDADMTDADSHSGWIAGSTNLTAVTLPSTAYAFSYAQFFKGCTNLRNVGVFPGGLKLITSMYRMFMDCTNGPEYFYGAGPCAATSWGGTFANSGVTYIDLTGSGCDELKSMIGFAADCKYLHTINLTNFNFGKSDCCQMLSGCVSLKHLTLKGAKTEGIWTCYHMFYHCEKLVTLDFGTASAPVTTNCDGMFDGCKALTTLDVSTFLPASISICYKMFANCTSMKSLTLPTGWCNTVDLGYMVALSQSSIAAIATALASGVKDKVITFDATIYAAIPATVVSTIAGKGWTITTVTY